MFTLLELSVSGALDFYFHVFTFTKVIVTPSYFQVSTFQKLESNKIQC